MATDDATGAPAAPSLKEAAANLGARTLDFAGNRLEHAAVEAAEARVRLFRSLLLVGIALLLALLALLVASFGIIAWFWDTTRMAAIVVLALVYAVAALVVGYRLRALTRDAPPLFGATLTALRADAAALRPGTRETSP
jgi:uncharacterized membrane protein YqjE